jgi:hypothetical protein
MAEVDRRIYLDDVRRGVRVAGRFDHAYACKVTFSGVRVGHSFLATQISLR